MFRKIIIAILSLTFFLGSAKPLLMPVDSKISKKFVKMIEFSNEKSSKDRIIYSHSEAAFGELDDETPFNCGFLQDFALLDLYYMKRYNYNYSIIEIFSTILNPPPISFS